MRKLIVIDGLDGCGKQTQVRAIANRLSDNGYKVNIVSFPDYDSDSSAAVKMYLSGELGSDPDKLNPYLCSLFYAVDRGIQNIKVISDLYEDDTIILCDRYLSANILHQGPKIDNQDDRNKFYEWVYDLEVGKVGLPRDDITIVLTLPIEVSQRLMSTRYNNDETKKDIHESNIEYLDKCSKNVINAVTHLSSLGYNWKQLDCSKDGEILSIDDITDMIWSLIEPVIKI